MDTFLQDLSFAARRLMQRPRATAGVLLVLALGIGATTAVFSVANGVLRRPLPLPQADRLIFITRRGDVSIPDGVDWRARSRGFEDIALFLRSWAFDLTGHGEPQRLDGAVVEPRYFRVLGVRPVRGRLLEDADDQPGGPRVAVLREGFWRQHFGADPNIVGSALTLSDHPTVVVGIAPDEADILGTGTALWVPEAVETPWARESRGTNNFDAIGRLRRDATIDQARSELRAISLELAVAYPNTNANKIVVPQLLLDYLVGHVRLALWVLLAAVALVQLLACVNLAGLLLARATARQSELALRLALGAAPRRLARLLITETALVAVGGCALGLVAAVWLKDGLMSLAPSTLPRPSSVVIDTNVIVFGVVIALASAFVFTWMPTRDAIRTDPATLMREGGRGGRLTRRGGKTLRALAVTEMALACVLLCGAMLLARSFARLRAVDLGFDASRVTVADIVLPESRYGDRERQSQAFTRIVEGLSQDPSIRSAAFVVGAPLAQSGEIGWEFVVDGRTPTTNHRTTARVRPVLGDYFQTLRLPIVAGRGFTSDDRPTGSPVAIVNETLARSIWPSEPALGKRLAARPDSGKAPHWLTVVGVAADVKSTALDASDDPAIYLPYLQREADWIRFGTVVVRSTAPSATVARALDRAVWAADPLVPVDRVRTMETLHSGVLAQPRFNSLVVGAFGAIALAIAVQGIFALLAFSVEQRRGEIGLRLALGADGPAVRRAILGDAARLAITGGALGIVGALAAGRVLTSLLFGVAPTDPVTYVAVAALLALAAMAGALKPAWRASRVDPAVVLRAE